MEARKGQFGDVELSKIDRPSIIARMEIDPEEIKRLAESMKERGLLQPIQVFKKGARFEIVFGDRRVMAANLLGWKKIPARIVEGDEKKVALDRAIENLQRADLTPVEEAVQYINMRDALGMDLEEISRRVGKSAGVVQRRLDVLGMPDTFQRALHEGKITLSVAEVLWSCPDPGRRDYFLDIACEHGCTLLVAKEWVADVRKSLRHAEGGAGNGGGGESVFSPGASYTACDICRGPVELSEIKYLRVCPGCKDVIMEGVRNLTVKKGGG